MAEKRPADSEPSEETLAICTNCSNISNNLRTCEHCGSALSGESTARCYSAEPLSKRARTASPETQAGQTSSSSSSSTSSSNKTAPEPETNGVAEGGEGGGGGDSAADPPSSAAGAETGTNSIVDSTTATTSGNGSKDTAASGSRSSTPVTGDKNSSTGQRRESASDKRTSTTTSTSTSSSSSASITVASSSGMNGAPVPQMLYMNNNARGPVPSPVGGPTPVGPPVPAGPPMPTGAVPLNMFVNVNNQAVQIPNQPGNSTADGARTRSVSSTSPAPARPSTNTASPPYPGSNAGSSDQAANVNKFSLVIDVHQIRVGVRKFLPMPNSSVLFKDDGVLFTLKEYPNAPLLLNARAIQQCKANLSSQMPALFFYLEGSCIKQIRNIFKMNQAEFSEKANDRVSTIALFPTTMDANRASGIKQAFEIMQRKFNRPQNLLKEVSSDAIVDFMYGYPPNTEASSAHMGGSRVAQPASGPPPLQSIQNNRAALPASVNSIQRQPSTMPAASQMLRTVARQSMVSGMGGHQLSSQMHPMMAQRQVRPNPPVVRNQSLSNRAGVPVPAPMMNPRAGGINNTPPLLTIPEDHEQWNNVKKKLVPGGVYQVQTRDGQRKYCLWNGTTLVPCLVQDQEVQLKCDYIRIGSLRCRSNDTVRVRNDGPNSGIYFKFLNPNTRVTEEVIITQEELVDCLVCFDRMCAMFIYPTANCATKIRSKCRMTSMSKDPTYNPFSKEERRRHLILFLKDINIDQKESLLKMKRTGLGDAQQRQMSRQIDPLQALQILSTIKQNTALSQTKIQDYFGKNSQSQDLESLARELQNPDGSDGVGVEAAVDDDDDDVIMTQEEIGVKCPYTQQVMKEPIKNRICQHNYEKAAILEFIARRKAKGNARCPYAGCGNQKPLVVEDLVENAELKQYIQKQIAEGNITT